jgi:hypothetical protein
MSKEGSPPVQEGQIRISAGGA